MPPRSKKADAPRLRVAMVGPDGTQRDAGEEIPQEWLDHPEFDLEALIASRGAKKK